MKIDEMASKLPKPDSTAMAAGAIGIDLQKPDDKKSIDKNTGKPKVLETNPDGITPKPAGETTDPTTHKKLKVDSEGNIVKERELTKEEILAIKTQKILDDRKAEITAEANNKMIDAKIEKVRLDAF